MQINSNKQWSLILVLLVIKELSNDTEWYEKLALIIIWQVSQGNPFRIFYKLKWI